MIDGREGQVTRAFADNSLAEGADVVDLLRELTTRCAVMLEVASAGALLADAKGTLHVVAASSERTRNLELFHLQREDGPCSNCFREGAAVSVPDLGEAHDRLAHVATAANEAGFAPVHALPMRLRGHALGTLRLSGTSVGEVTDEDRVLWQALAHVASVALVQDLVAAERNWSPSSCRPRCAAAWCSTRPRGCSPNCASSTWTWPSPRPAGSCAPTTCASLRWPAPWCRVSWPPTGSDSTPRPGSGRTGADTVDLSHAHLSGPQLDSRSRLATDTDSVVCKPAEGVRWWSGRRSVSRCCAPATRSCSRRPGLSRPSGFDGGGRGHVLHHARRRTACGGRR